MIRACRPLLFLLLLPSLLGSTPALAIKLNFPELTGRVVDQAGVLSASTRDRLDQMLAKEEAETSNQVVVVTLRSLQGLEIEDYGYQLGRHWGIGQKGRDNGVLLIVAPNERQVRIEIGYGLEGVLTDALSHYIIQNAILPDFRRGDFNAGVLAGTTAILAALKGSYKPMPAKAPAPNWVGLLPFAVIVVIFVLVFYYQTVAPAVHSLNRAAYARRSGYPVYPGHVGYRPGRRQPGYWTWFVPQLIFQILFSLLLSGGRGSGGPFGGGSSQSGGGFSGGGGSFGGGGASGRW